MVMKEFEDRCCKHLLDVSKRKCLFMSGILFPVYLVHFQGFASFTQSFLPFFPSFIFSLLPPSPSLLESGNIMVDGGWRLLVSVKS